MKVKLHSIMYGYREMEARVDKDPKGRTILFVEGIGDVTPLDYIKQGIKLLQASSAEMDALKAAGYALKNEMR